MQFEQATSVHVQIILLSAYLTKMIGKDEIGRNQFVKRKAI
jgi:chromatin remodeling complex protein RSC6